LGVYVLKLRWLLDKHPVRTLDVVVGSSFGKLCCGLTADWSPRAVAGPLRCDYGILTRSRRMRRTMRKTMLGKVSQSMSTPGCSGYCALPARQIAAAIWRMLASDDTMSA
jgi:hypothetical protein